MTNANDARKAHKILDDLIKGNMVLDEECEFLRSALPELPKQKTLEEISVEVEGLCDLASSSEGFLPIGGMGVRPRLEELHAQIKGLIQAPSQPALPAGMRLADHKDYGRCVVSPGLTGGGLAIILALNDTHESGAMWAYTRPDSLAYAEEHAKPAHPEFLETEADYRDAPVGTIVACDDSPSWNKRDSLWQSVIACGHENAKCMSGIRRRVLRWGWGE